jgi:hypothetical protein
MDGSSNPTSFAKTTLEAIGEAIGGSLPWEQKSGGCATSGHDKRSH